MAVKIVNKQKEKEEIVQGIEQNPEVATLLAPMVELALQMKEIEHQLKMVKSDYNAKVKKLLFEVDLNAAPEDKFEFKVGEHMLTVSAIPNSTGISDLEGAFEKLAAIDEALPLKVAKITLADLRKYLSGVELEEVTETVRTGTRKITVK